jgi:hypothetical protein
MHIGPEVRAHAGEVLNAFGDGFGRLARYLKSSAIRVVAGPTGLVAKRNRKNGTDQNEKAGSKRQSGMVGQLLWASVVTLGIFVAMCAEVAVDEPVDAAPPVTTNTVPTPQSTPAWQSSDLTAGFPLPLAAAPFDSPPMPRTRPTDPIRLAQQHAAHHRSPNRNTPPLHLERDDEDDRAVQMFAPAPQLRRVCPLPFLMFMSPQELRACGVLPLSYPRAPSTSNGAIY